MTRLLFVCSGNTCRSPMVAALTRHFATLESFDISVQSAGSNAKENAPITPEAGLALDEMNIAHSHQSTQLTLDHLRTTDIAFGMEQKHVATIAELARSLPSDLRPIIALLDDPNEIQDPLGQGIPSYRRLSMYFDKLIPPLIARHGSGYVKSG